MYISDFKTLTDSDVAFYADDSVFICHGKISNAIVKRLRSADNIFSKWKIRVNENKPQAILFPFNNFPKQLHSR